MKTYIQIGSNIGKDAFQTQIEELQEKAKVILIEANPELIPQLKNNYSHLAIKHEIIINNIAIAINQDMKFVELNCYVEDGHSTLLKRKSMNMEPLKVVRVKCLTFEELCEMHNIQKVELLQIDTEGLDYEIVNSIDFNKIDIRSLIFESWQFDQDDLNETYRSGPNFLESVLRPKLSNYVWEGVWLDNHPNIKLTKDDCL